MEDDDLKSWDSVNRPFAVLPAGLQVKKGEALFPRVDIKKELEAMAAEKEKELKKAEKAEKKEAKAEKHVFMYLIAFFFFINGVYTIIDMATAYGSALGLDTTGLLLALLLTQIVAFPCAIIFGRLSAKYDTGLLIKI